MTVCSLRKLPILVATGLLSAASAQAAEDPVALKFFETKIRPVLSDNCFECHGPDKQKHGLRVDNIGYLLEGGKNGPVVVKGDAAGSMMYQAVSYEDPDLQMPPDDHKLADNQIADLKKWIEMGAPWPEAEAIQPRKKGEFTAEERGWWSFQPVAKVSPPELEAGPERIYNEVDKFIVKKLREVKIPQAPEAENRALLRRLYYDLHGLPPTEAEVQAYLADADPEKYPKLVDRLLASPKYGMRWGQHWLDLVRYAESDGYRQDEYRPEAWRYRDYVIDSFNTDKPYDQFVREQLAGDELNPDEPTTLIGTALLRHGIYEWNQADIESQRNLVIEEVTGLTGELFLGMSVGCAQCHDHKFDPILHEDWFRLKAFFEPLQWRDDLALATPAEKKAHGEALAAWEAKAADKLLAWEKDVQKAKKQAIGKVLPFPPAEVQDMWRKPEAERTPYEKQVAYYLDRRIIGEAEGNLGGVKKESAAWKAFEPFDKEKPKDLPTAFVATDIAATSPPTFMEDRGGKKEIAPGFLTILAPGPAKVTPRPDIGSTGRRTALAEWIANPKNPLSTRVIVNRVWQYHFGRGLSSNASEFGKLGEEPTHPELLDWLTTGFLENGWSLKWLHREMVNSATYRQTALVASSSVTNETDPGNLLLWRFRPQRLDAEQIRDTILMASGELQDKTGGPAVDASKPVPSIFIEKKRNSPDEFLRRFDSPAGFRSVAQRDATNTPLQSLLMVNAEWPMDRARVIASQVLKENPGATSEELANAAFVKIYGRPASGTEFSAAAEFMEHQRVYLDKKFEAKPELVGPVTEALATVPGVVESGKALHFQPGTDHERIRVNLPEPEPDEFTVEAVVNLDSVYGDSSVRPIAARWGGNPDSKGWSLGLTSEKSRYGPRQLIMQITGDDFQGEMAMEVVASGLFLDLKKPYYIAAVLSTQTPNGQDFGGQIRFYVKDLSNPNAQLQEATIPHPIGGAWVNPDWSLAIGGRSGGKGHMWEGTMQRVSIHAGLLSVDKLMISKSPAANPLFDLQASSLAENDPKFEWFSETEPVPSAPSQTSAALETLADLCHVLLNSNEFLYLQ